MRTLLLVLVPFYLCFACNNKTKTPNSIPEKTTEEDSINKQNRDEFMSNTSDAPKGMNQKDANGFKQGHWIIYGKDFPERRHPAEAKLEEGKFNSDLREGEWLFYAKDGRTVESRLNYKSGILNDTSYFYYFDEKYEVVVVYERNKVISTDTVYWTSKK